ncbi:MAG: hypothetical protein M3424_01465 [Actinomycetota bacterium]|nr:hypothetical protein [Actinomycetota bacterium]
MGLRGWLTRQAVAGAHVLVVEVPGAWSTRVAVEQALAQRGWQYAVSPADADVLVVCGRPGEQLAAAVDVLWEHLPGPRTRVGVASASEAGRALADAEAQLLDDRKQREEARQRPTSPALLAESHDSPMDHGDMDHGDMDMSGPGGIALAGGGPDRDGLAMDVLHLPLGPVLPHWPPGLVLRCALQGDVISESEVEVLDPVAAAHPPVSAPRLAAQHCDVAADLLAVAGWDSMAATARRHRDLILAAAASASAPGPASASAFECVAALERVTTRIARSRTLRWALRDLGIVDDAVLAGHRLPESTRGDVHDRLLRLLVSAGDLLRDQPAPAPVPDPSPVLAALPALVHGLDIGAARLVVASLAPLPVESAAHAPAPADPAGGHA